MSHALAAISTTVIVFCVKYVLRQEKELSISSNKLTNQMQQFYKFIT